MFSLYYCFLLKLDECYKREKYCQMPESYGFCLLFLKVECAEIHDCCFTKVLIISLPDFLAKHFCILLMKVFQLKLSIAERCALNKYKCGTIPSRKKEIIHACFYFSEKFCCRAKNILLCLPCRLFQIPQP